MLNCYLCYTTRNLVKKYFEQGKNLHEIMCCLATYDYRYPLECDVKVYFKHLKKKRLTRRIEMVKMFVLKIFKWKKNE